MEQQTREDIAGALLSAYSSRIPVGPLTGQCDDLTVEDAYEIQLLQVAEWTAADAQVKGHKFGLTAFVLARPLREPGVTIAEATAAVGFVLPALELIDSRIRDWRIGLADTIADNASSGGVILGSTPVALAGLDPRLAGCNLHKNGELAGTGAGGAVLGSPLTALAWLANTFAGPGRVTARFSAEES